MSAVAGKPDAELHSARPLPLTHSRPPWLHDPRVEALPAARWMKTHAPTAMIAVRCSNIPSVHLAIKSGAGIAPLPAVYAAADEELVCVLGPLPELNYSLFRLTHTAIFARYPAQMSFLSFASAN